MVPRIEVYKKTTQSLLSRKNKPRLNESMNVQITETHVFVIDRFGEKTNNDGDYNHNDEQ